MNKKILHIVFELHYLQRFFCVKVPGDYWWLDLGTFTLYLCMNPEYEVLYVFI